MLRIGIAVVLLAHGIGHSLGLLQMFKVATVNPAWQGDSWLLTGAAGATVTQIIGGLVWTAAIIGFAALAATVVGWLPASWFTTLALASAVVSLVGLVLFPIAFPTVSTIGALAIDLVLLVAVAWNHWTPSELAS